MGKLMYTMLVSLDGFICDQNGNFDWVQPKEDVHSYINDLERKSEILLLGRKLYDILVFWENVECIEKYPAYIQEYEAIWKSKRKIVFSRSLKEATTKNTVLKNEFLPEEIKALKRRRGAISAARISPLKRSTTTSWMRSCYSRFRW
jgi:dihydrofolate reductase